MAAGSRITTVDNRTSVAQLFVYNIHPFVHMKEFTIQTANLGAVVEILLQRSASNVRHRSTSACIVIHVYRYAAVRHQRCHSFSLSGRISSIGIIIRHIRPVIGRRSEIRPQCQSRPALRSISVACAAGTLCRITVIIHDLSH